MLTIENTVAAESTPSTNISTAVVVKRGDFRRWRRAILRSRKETALAPPRTTAGLTCTPRLEYDAPLSWQSPIFSRWIITSDPVIFA